MFSCGKNYLVKRLPLFAFIVNLRVVVGTCSGMVWSLKSHALKHSLVIVVSLGSGMCAVVQRVPESCSLILLKDFREASWSFPPQEWEEALSLEGLLVVEFRWFQQMHKPLLGFESCVQAEPPCCVCVNPQLQCGRCGWVRAGFGRLELPSLQG